MDGDTQHEFSVVVDAKAGDTAELIIMKEVPTPAKVKKWRWVGVVDRPPHHVWVIDGFHETESEAHNYALSQFIGWHFKAIQRIDASEVSER
jgi:hypothetical protein